MTFFVMGLDVVRLGTLNFEDKTLLKGERNYSPEIFISYLTYVLMYDHVFILDYFF